MGERYSGSVATVPQEECHARALQEFEKRVPDAFMALHASRADGSTLGSVLLRSEVQFDANLRLKNKNSSTTGYCDASVTSNSCCAAHNTPKYGASMIPVVDFAAPSRYASLPMRTSDRFAKPRVTPSDSAEQVLTQDGRRLTLRAICPADVAAMQRCFARLSPEDIRRRFLHAMSELPAPMAERMCRVDSAIETAYVLMDATATPEEMRGVGRIYVDESTDSAEFSVLVEHDWSRLGLGALLMQRLVDDCRKRALDEVWGYVLHENRPMLKLCEELGFTRRMLADEPGTAQITLKL